MADCLIMTTEILMLMLSKNSIKIKDIDYQINIEDDVFAIIFDEVHYINDADRGNVWEKSIMMIPKNITILMLSATIAKAANFLEWVHSCNDNKSFLLTNERRVVPLIFNFLTFSTKLPKALIPYDNYLNKLVPIMNTNDFKIDYTSINTFIELQKYFDKNKINVKWLINYTCKYLSINNLCPALFFVFSKKTCFHLAESITEHFNTDVEARQVEKDIQFYLSKLEHKEDYMKTKQYYQILDLAKKGIAVHHSGLIPVFKEIIEMLFSKNQIK
jgi:antiviral helicase SKI2